MITDFSEFNVDPTLLKELKEELNDILGARCQFGDKMILDVHPGLYAGYWETFRFLVNKELQQQEWSKEPPTEPGWYWIYNRGQVEPIEVKQGNHDLYIMLGSIGHYLNTTMNVQWMKMNVPNPPKE